MNRKIAIIFLALMCFIATCLVGCSGTEYEIKEEPESLFEYVEKFSDFNIVYDKETKVMYSVSNGSHGGRGVFTMLVNADGTPKLYKED